MNVKASKDRISIALKQIDPGAHGARYRGVHRLTNPIPYRAEYFGHRLHADQNEKLEMYGCTTVAAVDGFSGFIPAFSVMAVKSNSIIYEEIYRKSVLQYGMWDTIVVDKGKEFCLMLGVQRALQNHRTNTNRTPTIEIDSMRNNRIERFWPEVNSRISYALKDALHTMVDSGSLDLSNPVHKFSCSTAAQQVVHEGLKLHVMARNHRHVAKRGVPVELMAQYRRTYPIDQDIVPTTWQAFTEYNANGGQLQEPLTFGIDPFAHDAQKQEARDAYMSQFLFSPLEIFRFSAYGQTAIFQEFVREYIKVNSGLVSL